MHLLVWHLYVPFLLIFSLNQDLFLQYLSVEQSRQGIRAASALLYDWHFRLLTFRLICLVLSQQIRYLTKNPYSTKSFLFNMINYDTVVLIYIRTYQLLRQIFYSQKNGQHSATTETNGVFFSIKKCALYFKKCNLVFRPLKGWYVLF